MGLFCTTIINRNSTNVIVDNSALTDATNRNAEATEKLVKSTDTLADRVGDDRIRISHSRYAELNNKSEKLLAIKKYVRDLITSTFKVATQSDNFNNIGCISMMNGRTVYFESLISDDTYLILSEKHKTVDIYKRVRNIEYDPDSLDVLISGFEPTAIDEPNLMKEECGEVEMSGVEYKKAISLEREFDDIYSNIRKILPRVIFNMINPTNPFASQRFKNNIINGSKFTEKLDGFVFEFDAYRGVNIRKDNGGK